MSVLITGLLSAALLAPGELQVAAAAPQLLAPVTKTKGAGRDGRQQAVARIVKSIAEYTVWPSPRNPLRLCVAGPAKHATGFGELKLMDGRLIHRRDRPLGAIGAGGCDILYMGGLPGSAASETLARLRGRSVLTISEADPRCSSQAMVCILFTVEGANFRFNVDAVARSPLRIDPRVLRLSKGQS